jgi:VWFA-related protein
MPRLALAVALGLSASSQAPQAARQSASSSSQQPPPPAFHVGIDAVRIDAVVTDKHDKVVTDLTADDFELRQDGDPQVVTVAQYVRESSPVAASSEASAPRSAPDGLTSAAPAPGRPLAADRVQRTIAFVVDDLGLSWESIYQMRRAMHAFIDERVQPGDLVGILRTSTYSGALQQFTTDKRRLHGIVDQVRYTALSRRRVEPVTQGVDEVYSALATLDTLRSIIQGARALSGRKVVVLLSEGFRLDTDTVFTDPRILRSSRSSTTRPRALAWSSTRWKCAGWRPGDLRPMTTWWACTRRTMTRSGLRTFGVPRIVTTCCSARRTLSG